MKFKSLIAGAAVASVTIMTGATSAWALCGTISQKATGSNREVAIAKANAAGKVEVRRLEKTYGRNGVRYQPAKVACSGSGPRANGFSIQRRPGVECIITQRFCTR